MGTPRGINQKGKYTSLNARLNRYLLLVQGVFDACSLETAKIAERTGYAASDVPFRFSDFPETKDAMKKVQSRFVEDIGAIIHRGTSDEWKQSNIVQDLLADKVLKYYGSKAGGEKHKVYYQTNSDVLKAFQQRKISGEFHLSEAIWDQSENMKQEMEYAISSALEKGIDAVTLSKRLSKYLKDFDRLKDDYKERYGKAVECEDCEYRSLRLARSEINMAYRTAEWTRWQQMDFVIGFEIKLSKSHHDRMPNGDICDMLAGKYPKTIKWTGWHPNDMCYVVPILKDEDDFWADDDEPSKNEVTDVPDNMKNWLADHAAEIVKASKKGTLPYWLRDNRSLVNEASKALQPFEMTEEIRSELITRGFSKRAVAVEAFNKSAMAGFNVSRFDRKFEGICDEYECRIGYKHLIDCGDGEVRLKYSARDKDDDKLTLTRLFRFEQSGGSKIPVVDHEEFVLPEPMQGIGIGKRVFRDLFEQYELCGIQKVYIKANMERGGLCWAKYGAMARKKDITWMVEEAAARGKITQQELDEAMSFISQCGDYVPMQKLAYSGFGNRLLLNSSWEGLIDLKNGTQMKYLHDYIGM